MCLIAMFMVPPALLTSISRSETDSTQAKMLKCHQAWHFDRAYVRFHELCGCALLVYVSAFVHVRVYLCVCFALNASLILSIHREQRFLGGRGGGGVGAGRGRGWGGWGDDVEIRRRQQNIKINPIPFFLCAESEMGEISTKLERLLLLI